MFDIFKRKNVKSITTVTVTDGDKVSTYTATHKNGVTVHIPMVMTAEAFGEMKIFEKNIEVEVKVDEVAT